MDYKKLYESLITKAKSVNGAPYSIHSRRKNYAAHHIVPFCFFPGAEEAKRRKKDFIANHPDNLVYMTYREHFIAHRLLARIYGGQMVTALLGMIRLDGVKHSINARRYALMVAEGIKITVTHPNSINAKANFGKAVIAEHLLTGHKSFFKSASATRMYGFSPGNVTECCNKKGGRTQHKGYTFRWASEEEIEAKDSMEWVLPTMAEAVTFFTGISTTESVIMVCAGTAGLRSLGVHHSSVCSQIAGKGRRKSVGGYVWRYATQEEIDLYHRALLHKHRGYVNISQPN